MSETLQRNQERLENVQIIEPLLGALRTISLGGWRSALNKKSSMQVYTNKLLVILNWIVPVINIRPGAKPNKDRDQVESKLILAIGSDRGLCGKFDSILLDRLGAEFLKLPEKKLRVWMSGDRLIQSAQQRGIEVHWEVPLTGKSYPTYLSVYRVARRMLYRYESFNVDEVEILYNHYENAGKYHPVSVKLLPFEQNQFDNSQMVSDWPEPIIETDPVSIYERVMEQLITITLYNYFLVSSASEHSTRYTLMEEAGKNAGRMIEELNQVVQMGRRHSITQEMQELAAGAGLIK